ncbi:hypothetical protein T9A_00234 [Alcanivorax jadensis T9]|uniref:DUF2523 domain-containing protein n=1 Tax=Alcanivorax jadensis T9 TaxID=1177181 RepID=A0ABR4WI85_9GAMM|nr:DUF2523 family protein [Alcanivorax jadensis]KGD62914.1 hypothetical protein T9A_00234 [Alcanivorax jadensis T9]
MEASLGPFEWLWSKLVGGFEWLLERITYIYLSMWETYWAFLVDAVSLVFDLLMGLAVTLLDALGQQLNFDPQQYINALPGEVLNVMGALHLGSATLIITAAIVIRLLLQLIPFVRLGS